MAVAQTLLEPNKALRDREEIYQWLRDQAERLGLHVTLSTDAARVEGGYLYLPVYIPEARDPYDFAVKSQALEDTWNDQEPRPDPPVYLTPEKSPEQRAVWQRLWEARDRKTEAANAVAEAGEDLEQQAALAELRAARADEVQAEKEYNAFYQQNRAAENF